MSDLAAQLREIEEALDRDAYRRGAWQAFLDAADRVPAEERDRLAAVVDRVSDKLHGRGGRRRFPLERALGLEILGAFAGLVALGPSATASPVMPLLLAAAILATTFQPLLKVGTGFALGLGYSYAYLAGVEPRFKLRYGRYLAAPRWRRVALHLSGALGSPFALWLAATVSAEVHDTAARVLLAVAIADLVFQLSLFSAAVAGVRRLPVLGLLRLTSAGAAGDELRRAFRSPPARAGV